MPWHKLHTAIHRFPCRSNWESVSDVQQNLHHTGLYSSCIVPSDSHGIRPVSIALCLLKTGAVSFFVITLLTICPDGTWNGSGRCRSIDSLMKAMLTHLFVILPCTTGLNANLTQPRLSCSVKIGVPSWACGGVNSHSILASLGVK